MEELNQSKIDLLKGLVSSDERKVDTKYKYDIRYQEEILSMLLMDKVFLIQSMQLIKPKYFVDKAHELICEVLFDYFNKYKQTPPKFTILNEIKERKKTDPQLFYYQGTLETLVSQYVSGLESREACLDKIAEFAKEQAMRSAVSMTLDILERNQEDKWSKISSIFREALSIDRSFDVGLDYFQTVEERYKRMDVEKENKEVFITGLSIIDNNLSMGGLCRGEMGAFMAMSGGGKSICLSKVAVHNLLRNKKVLYISLEMDQDKIARRFDAQLALTPIFEIEKRRKYVMESLADHVKDHDDKRRLIIKQFPAGTCNVDTIRAYMAQMQLYGFKPDLLIVDYIGEMKDFEGVKTYESRQRLVRDLRGFSVEEQHCTFTALQPNRRGREQQEDSVIDDDAIGDSYGQIRPLDALWTLNQRPNEKAMNVGRLFIAKHRDGKSRLTFPFKQNKETLDIRAISEEEYHSILNQYTTKAVEETGKNIKEFKPNRS
jgi:replicative DNA helicase